MDKSKRINWRKVNRAKKLKSEGMSVSAIARKMKEHRRQVQRFLNYSERATVKESV